MIRPTLTMRDLGLLVFCLVQILNVCGLALDGVLVCSGMPTVTDYARRHWWVTIAILALNVAGFWGLATHLGPEDMKGD